jgi:spore germination protein
MRKILRAGCLLVVALACLAVLAMLYTVQVRSTALAHGAALNQVTAWIPTSWDSERARNSWEAHQAHIQELSPVWYQLGESGDGTIERYDGACDTALVQEAHDGDALVIPLINNCYADGFDATPVSTVIHSSILRAVHVALLVSETLTCNYDGIDIDYESLDGTSDREPFSLFVEELAAALHAEGKLLSATVHPKTAEPGSWNGPRAQDWARVGAAADRFRVMTYAYSWQTGPPGPIAPLFWMENVAAFASSVVRSDKIYLGIHFYGLDWGAGPAAVLEWEGAQDLTTMHSATRQWAAENTAGRAIAEPWFTYTAGSTQHEAWYADGASVAARLHLVERYGLGGVAVWRLGGEDPANWTAIAAILHPASRLHLPLLLSYP